jgi:hypothetical protein
MRTSALWKPMTEIDQFSLTTVPIELFFNKTSLGHATAFVWKSVDNRYFLITNWHVVSGRDATTALISNPTQAAQTSFVHCSIFELSSFRSSPWTSLSETRMTVRFGLFMSPMDGV